jgi:signal transduction histidine kinase/ligand-binding sensor domain-containing protein
MKRAIIILLLIIYFGNPLKTKANVAFYYYGIENGLPETQIYFITQDSSGFIWLAGQNTLFRFDGSQFKNYLNRGTEQVLKGKINALFVDSKGILRVGTESGILQYDFLYDRFSGPEPGWERVHVSAIDEDYLGRIWAGTDEGLACFNPETKETEWYTGTDTIKVKGNDILPFSAITQLVCHPDGKIWFGGNNSGLCLFDPEKRKVLESNIIGGKNFSKCSISKLWIKKNRLFIGTLTEGLFIYDQENKNLYNKTFNSLGTNIHSFHNSEDSVLWLATNNGLVKYNLENEKFRIYINEPMNPLSLARTAVVFVFVDDDKNVWVSNGIKGINYGLNNTPFSYFEISGTVGNSLTHKEVTSMLFDHQGNMWVGYEAGFVEMINRDGAFKKQIDNPLEQLQMTGSVMALYEDSKNRIWKGGWRNGLCRLNDAGNAFEYAPMINDSLAEIMKFADIRGITEDTNGKIWVSLHGKGIGCYNPETGSINLYGFDREDPPSSLSNDYTFDLCTDDKDNLWVATAHGVTRVNLSKRSFYSYFHVDGNDNSLSSNTINTIHCSHDNRIWAGTSNGLNIYLPAKDCFNPVLTDNDIPFLNISAISSVKPGEIWFSSNAGIVRLTYSATSDSVLQTGYTIYNRSDGLFSSTFFPRSVAAGNNGLLYFGGNESIDYFDPRAVEKWSEPEAKPRITDVMIDGKRAVIERLKNIEDNPVVVLKYNDRMISLRFTSLKFNEQKSNATRYKLENFNEEWIYPQNEQVATFTNLKPGKYRFLLEIKGNNGSWINLDTPLILIVNPPFWKTVPFYIISIVVVIVLIYAFHRYQTRRYFKRQKELELEIEKRTIELVKKNEELESANKAKAKFFSIISHDLRSPFSSVIGILDLLNEPGNGIDEAKKKELLGFAFVSAKNTFDLLETLLMWARSQMNQIVFKPAFNDLAALLKNNIELKQLAARGKEINLINKVPSKLEAFYDNDMIHTVARNILGNALKFTNKGGDIVVSALISGGEAIVSIADTGVGMSADEMKNLFELGVKSKNGTQGERGTGLGLIICKEFVEKNGGKIWVTANEPQGTVFHFTLPLSEVRDS